MDSENDHMLINAHKLFTKDRTKLKKIFLDTSERIKLMKKKSIYDILI